MTDSGPSPISGPPPRAGAGRIGEGLPAQPPIDAAGPNYDGGKVGVEPSVADPEFWIDDVAEQAPQPRRKRGIESSIKTLIEWVAVAVGALAVALLIKAFLLQAFYIPSASMVNTLHEDDRVLVNKLSYRLGDINRGDVIVFEKPPGAGGEIEDFIKRVIALPGETITFVSGDVYIDGVRLDEPYTEGQPSNPRSAAIVSEGCTNDPVADRCSVADGWYFMMGDNRGNSTDSRAFGPIREETVVGRAFLKVWPLSDLGFL